MFYIMKTPVDVRQVRIPLSLYERLRKMASQDLRKPSAQVAWLIEKELAARANGSATRPVCDRDGNGQR